MIFYYKEEVPNDIDEIDFIESLEFYFRFEDEDLPDFNQEEVDNAIRMRDEKVDFQLDMINLIRNYQNEEGEFLDEYFCEEDEESLQEKRDYIIRVCNATVLRFFLESRTPPKRRKRPKITYIRPFHEYFNSTQCKKDCMMFKFLNIDFPSIKLCESQVKSYSCPRARHLQDLEKK